MSAAACIEFVAPFKEELLPYLEYPEPWYKNCDSTSLVRGILFEVNGGHASKEIADTFKVEMRDPSTWRIKDLEVGEMFAASLYAIRAADCTEEIRLLRQMLTDDKCIVMYNLRA